MRATLLVLGLVISNPASAEADVEAGPVKMTAREIKAYNAALPANDPAYIVCVKSAPTGSLVTLKSCRTREEWARLAVIGNDDARALVNDAQTRQFSIRQEPEFPTNGRPN